MKNNSESPYSRHNHLGGFSSKCPGCNPAETVGATMKESTEEIRSQEVKLFHVQDSDRPMWVIATDWHDAVEKWKAKIREENEGECNGEPKGIQLVCDEDDLLQ